MFTMVIWIVVGAFFSSNGIQLPFDQISLALLSVGLYGAIYEIDTGVARQQPLLREQSHSRLVL